MENRISLQDLAEKLAGSEGGAKKKIDAFTRSFFEIIEEALLRDNFVKIKGFGTFKIVAVSERESVSVNTGERIQISGHSKVSFTPDNQLKDMVNRPFAHFETVIINDGVDISEFDNIEVELPEPIEETEESVAEESLSAEETPQIVVAEAAEVEPSPEEPATPTADNELKESDGEILELIETNQTEENPVVQDSPTETPQETVVDTKETATVPEDILVAAEEQCGPEEAFATPEVDKHNSDQAREEVTSTEKQSKGCVFWKVLCHIIAILLLISGSYFAGYHHLLGSCEFEKLISNMPADDTLKTETSKDSIAPVKVAKQTASPKAVTTGPDSTMEVAPKENALPSAPQAMPQVVNGSSPEAARPAPVPVSSVPKAKGKHRIVGTRATYTISEGETLRTIAENVYGSRSYATYIISHNNIKNPDNVQVGSTIELPELERIENDSSALR